MRRLSWWAGVVLLLITAAIALPNLLRSCCGSNEMDVTRVLRNLNTAMVTYSTTYERGFPDSLLKLAPPPRGRQPNMDRADLLPDELAAVMANRFSYRGYRVAFTPGSGPSIKTYIITAEPLERGKTGQRSFFTDETAVIRSKATTPATASDTAM